MKTTILISLLSITAFGSYAQSQEMDAMKRLLVHEKAKEIYCETNGNMGAKTLMPYKTNYSIVHAAYPDAPANAVPARPSVPYFALQEPPCYKYTDKNGREIMECPGASFTPRRCDMTATAINENQVNGNIDVHGEKSYSGYYHSVQAVYPEAPANAVPAWPTAAYTELKDPPCYKYTNKRGVEVKECPGARFEPEHR